MTGRYGSDGRLQIDIPVGSTINATGIIALSAGTEQATTGTVTFADSNGFVWGLSNNVMTVNATGLTAAANINVSAGTTSNLLSALTLSNSNNVSFGLNSSTVTASYALRVEAGTATGTAANSLSLLSFANSNGVSFGISSGTLTASMSGGGGGGTQTGISGIANSETTYTSGTVSFSELGAITIRSTTGQQFQFSVNPQTAQTGISGIQVSDTTYTSGTVTFRNANSISFGSSGANGITASVSFPAQTNQTLGIYGISNTTGESSSSTYDARSLSFEGAGIASVGWSNSSWIVSATQSNQAFSAGGVSSAFQTLVFQDSNGLSFSNNAGSIRVSYTVPSVTNSSLTIQDTATTINALARIALGTANGLTLSLSTTTGGSVTLNGSYTVPSTAGLISAINVSGGTTSSNVSAITFANGTGVSFQYDGTNLSANINANRVAINGANASAAGSANFVNANNISFNFSGAGNTRVTASYEFDLSAGTTSSGVNGVTFSDANGIGWLFDATNLSATVNHLNSNGIQWGLTGNSITANVGYLSYYENMPLLAGTVTQTAGNSTQNLIPFNLPLAGSFSYLRQLLTMSANSTSFASTNTGTAFSGSLFSTHYVVIYSMGTGANSKSLQSVTSASAGFSEQLSFSVSGGAGAGTRWSVSYKFTHPSEGATNATFSTSTALSSTRYDIAANGELGNYNGIRNFDIPLSVSLSAGAYWMAFGQSSTSSTQSIAALTGAHLDNSYLAASQVNLQIFAISGGAIAPQLGIGTFSTNAMTTGSIALANINSISSYPRLFFQLIRQA